MEKKQLTESDHRFVNYWESRILHGVFCEWQAACWGLPWSVRERMRAPVFVLKDFENRLGCWMPEKREIALSRRLVTTHSWQDVREVLLHEMAHQYAHEVLGAFHETSHGPSFQKACRLFQANPKATASYVPLSQHLHRALQEGSDKIRMRIEKLLALAGSSNPHEAESAMIKAHELMAKYETDRISRQVQQEYFSVFVGKSALRHFQEDYNMGHLLSDYYFVKIVWVSSYIFSKGKMGTVMEISGTVQNVQIAGYVFDFITKYIDAEWRRYTVGKKLNRYRKTDFAVGILSGFRSKLEKEVSKQQTSESSRSLATIEDPLLNQYFSERYPRLETIRGRAVLRNYEVLADGTLLGKKLVIRKGVTSPSNHSGKLLE